jgi:glucokinase
MVQPHRRFAKRILNAATTYDLKRPQMSPGENGPACKCGSIGCLEATAGTSAVEARMCRAIAEGALAQALQLVHGDPAEVTAWMALEAAAAGDKMSGNIVSELARDIGFGIANVVNLFNPAVVVFDKRLEPGGKLLLDQISRVVRGQTLASFSADLALRFGKIGEEAGLLGIGLCVLEKRYEIPALRPPSFMIADALGEPFAAPSAPIVQEASA